MNLNVSRELEFSSHGKVGGGITLRVLRDNWEIIQKTLDKRTIDDEEKESNYSRNDFLRRNCYYYLSEPLLG